MRKRQKYVCRLDEEIGDEIYYNRLENLAENKKTHSKTEEDISAYFRSINKFRFLSKDEEREKFHLYSITQDPELKQELIGSNLRFVISIAKNYTGHGLSLLDLIEEGNVGLTKAFNNFRLEANCRLSTYASWWINQSIKRSIVETSKTIRIPCYLIPKISEIRKELDKVKKTKGCKLDLESCLIELGYNEDKREIIKSALKCQRTPVQIDHIGDGESPFEVRDKNIEDPKDIVERKLNSENIGKFLKILNKRDSEILKMRYGLDGKEPMSLEEIGDKISISRERVRQIQRGAERKLNYILSKTKFAEAE